MQLVDADLLATTPTRAKQVDKRSMRAIYLAQYSQQPFFTQFAVTKRAFDIVLAAFALSVLTPLLLLITVCICLETKGAPLFRQKRWGKDLKHIYIFKFRTMYAQDFNESGTIQTAENDPRVTPLGRFLRKNNIDELPQLINIFIGDMSFVGPRCHPIGMRAGGKKYEELVPSYHQRHKVLPGLTGLAQLKGYRGPTTDPARARKRIAYDRLYLRRKNFLLDLQILVLTAWKELRAGSGS